MNSLNLPLIISILCISYNVTAKDIPEYMFDVDCSETTYCEDGYTTLGVDRLGNPRDYVYPLREITYQDYLKAYKYYDHQGYDQYGFNRNKKNVNGKYLESFEIIKY